jgi:ribosomal protein S18 acetylase RimI-like enzyme
MTDVLALRLAGPDDVTALYDLVRVTQLAERGEVESSPEEIAADLTRPACRNWIHETPTGRVDAAVGIEKVAGEAAVFGWTMVRPGQGDEWVAPLLDVALQQARELDAAAPLHIFVAASNAAKRAVYEAGGGTGVRRFLRLVMDVSAGVPALEPLPDVSIRAIRDSEQADLRAIYGVLEPAFLEHFGAAPSTYEQWVEARSSAELLDRSLWWLATVGGEPAGGLIGRLNPGRGWVEEVGTLPAFRGRGLARRLLLAAFTEFRARGFDQVGLGVDATNPTGAVGLYESIGMHRTHEWICYEFTP